MLDKLCITVSYLYFWGNCLSHDSSVNPWVRWVIFPLGSANIAIYLAILFTSPSIYLQPQNSKFSFWYSSTLTWLLAVSLGDICYDQIFTCRHFGNIHVIINHIFMCDYLAKKWIVINIGILSNMHDSLKWNHYWTVTGYGHSPLFF